MQLNRDVVRAFAPGRVFQENEGRINSLDFHRTEDLLVTAGEDDSIHVYNTNTGQSQKTLYSKKHGIHCVTFTHHPNSIVYASNKGHDHSLRYLSLYDNRYLRYFSGHVDRVTSLCLSPKMDQFMSSSMDKSVRMWDLRSHLCQGVLQVPNAVPTAAFDHQGLVLAVAANCGVLKLYDSRNYDKGPFTTFVVPPEAKSHACFSCLKFSGDGKYILGVVDGRIYVLDSFQGDMIHKQPIMHSESASPLEASFSPDKQFIIAGHEDKSIRAYNTLSGEETAAWSFHPGVPACVKWAPRKMLVASACSALALWIPDLERLALKKQ